MINFQRSPSISLLFKPYKFNNKLLILIIIY